MEAGGLIYNGTLIRHDDFFIATDNQAKLYIHSVVHNQNLILKDVGNGACRNLAVNNNILYLACGMNVK